MRKRKLIIILGQGRSGTTLLFRSIFTAHGVFPLRSEMPDFTLISELGAYAVDLNRRTEVSFNRRHGQFFLVWFIVKFVIIKGILFGTYECLKTRRFGKLFQRKSAYVTYVPTHPTIPVNFDFLKKFYDVYVIGIQRNPKDVLLSRTHFHGFQHYSFDEHVYDIVQRTQSLSNSNIDLLLRYEEMISNDSCMEQVRKITGIAPMQNILSKRIHPTKTTQSDKAKLDNLLSEYPKDVVQFFSDNS